MRQYQRQFINFWNGIEGPVRIVVLKPRQAGFSTLVAGKLFHQMVTEPHFTGLAMADKHGRTQAIANIFSTFEQHLNKEMKPMIATNNSDALYFNNPEKNQRRENPGLDSGIVYETANDPNAGRSASRRFAHLSEHAFYRYAKEIDDGVQNSIPLADNTAIIKESTANGRGGIGKAFYDLWRAAQRGESIYKPYFVAWYEVDDYKLKVPFNFKITKEEKEIIKRNPSVTEANLVWRRLKVLEYLSDNEDSLLGPEERFKQDFPCNDEEAFLNTGLPVFDSYIINALINNLNNSRPAIITHRLKFKSFHVEQYSSNLVVYSPPRAGKKYFIGADVSEGLADGDASSAYIMDSEYNQVGKWHGKIDPDEFGHLLIGLAEFFNDAFITVEKNNMGHTTVNTIKSEGYSRQFRIVKTDERTNEKTEKIGWETNKKTKQQMLNEALADVRDGRSNIKDVKLAEEMSLLSRADNGDVVLNGRDRVVAFCLALMGRKHYHSAIEVKPKKGKNLATGNAGDIMKSLNKKPKNDLFG